jgi:hypothetical protein
MSPSSNWGRSVAIATLLMFLLCDKLVVCFQGEYPIHRRAVVPRSDVPARVCALFQPLFEHSRVLHVCTFTPLVFLKMIKYDF